MNPGTILLVESNPEDLRLLREATQELGATVYTMNTGREALDQLRTIRPEIIVLSLVLPDMDGYEVFRQIRGALDTQDTFVVVLYPGSPSVDVCRAFALGADCSLVKPINAVELRQFLHRIPPSE